MLAREVNGRPLVYLDSASSSHKPTPVLDAERAFVEQHYSNVHRGVHTLSQEATDAYEGARATVAAFVGAQPHDLVFTKNVTEAINLVSYSLSNPGSPVAIGPGRRDRGHRDGAPLQPGAVAAAGGAHRRDPALARPGRRGPARPVRPRRGRQRADQAVRLHARQQHPRHREPGRRAGRPGPRGRCAHPARRCPVGAAPAGRRRRARRRLPRLHRPQDARPHRRRRAGRPALVCSTRCRRSWAAAR